LLRGRNKLLIIKGKNRERECKERAKAHGYCLFLAIMGKYIFRHYFLLTLFAEFCTTAAFYLKQPKTQELFASFSPSF